MAIPQHVQEFLTAHEIVFRHYSHPREPKASRTAASLHIPEKDFAQCFVVAARGRLALAVIPASERLDPDALAELLEVPEVRLATDRECQNAFRDCEAGAVPPFGSLYGLPVLLDFAFDDQRLLSIKAGTHTDVIQICLDDFRKAVRPRTGRLTRSRLSQRRSSRRPSTSAKGSTAVP